MTYRSFRLTLKGSTAEIKQARASSTVLFIIIQGYSLFITHSFIHSSIVSLSNPLVADSRHAIMMSCTSCMVSLPLDSCNRKTFRSL